MPDVTNLEVTAEHAVQVAPTQGQARILNKGPGTVYYGPTSGVSSTSNTGSLVTGQGLTVTVAVWLRGASLASVQVTNLPVAVQTPGQSIPPTIACIGASIEQNEGDGVPLGGPAPALSYADVHGPIQWANAFSDGKLRLVKNAGLAGITSEQMAANIDDPSSSQYCTAIDPAPGFFYIGHVCGDDVSGVISIARSVQAWLKIYSRIRQAYPQAIIIVCTLPGVNIAGNVALRAALNPVIKQAALANANTLLFDFEGLFTDPATGLPRTTLSQDQIHPNPSGGSTLGQALATLLSPWLPQSTGFVNDYTNDARVTPGNGGWGIDAMMRGTPGANTTATNWIWAGAGGGATPAGATRALVARSDQYGNWQEMVWGGTAGVLVTYRAIPATLPPGTVVQVECECQFRGNLVGFTDLSILLSNSAGFTLAALGNQLANQGPYVDPGAGVTIAMRTPPATVPAGAVVNAGNTFLQMAVNSGTATTGSIRFGRASLIVNPAV